MLFSQKIRPLKFNYFFVSGAMSALSVLMAPETKKQEGTKIMKKRIIIVNIIAMTVVIAMVTCIILVNVNHAKDTKRKIPQSTQVVVKSDSPLKQVVTVKPLPTSEKESEDMKFAKFIARSIFGLVLLFFILRFIFSYAFSQLFASLGSQHLPLQSESSIRKMMKELKDNGGGTVSYKTNIHDVTLTVYKQEKSN